MTTERGRGSPVYMIRPRRLALLSLAVIVVACSPSGASAPVGSTATGGGASGAPSLGDPNADKLAQVIDRGTLVLSTDIAYPPQSFSVAGAQRLADTKCAAKALTGPEVDGYDVETGKLVAAALGVEPCFVVPSWTEITGGNWGDRWDIAYGSGSINADRMTRLWMTQPYYGVPNHFFVRADSSYQKATDLNGKQIGACASCSHEYYLKGELEIPGTDIVVEVQDPKIVTYETEPSGLQDVADGKIDAFLAAAPVGNEAIKEGLDLRPIEKPAFTYYPSGFVDKGSGMDSKAFLARVNEIIRGLQADGTLKATSMEFFGADFAQAGADFDLDAIGQVVP